MRSVDFVVLVLVLGVSGSTADGAKKASKSLSRDRLAETAELYFTADPSYHPDDLLVRSQVAGFQDYLRKTQGASRATRSQLLRRIEPDSSRLARIFFSKNGRSTLRIAAQKLGGYEPLVHHCKTKRGLKSLKEAVKQGQGKQLAKQIAAKEALDTQSQQPADSGTHSKSRASSKAMQEGASLEPGPVQDAAGGRESLNNQPALERVLNKPNVRKSTSRLSRIYTVEQLLKAMLAPSSIAPSVPPTDPSNSSIAG